MIQQLDSVWCITDIRTAAMISPCLKYKAEYYRAGRFGKQRQEYDKFLIDKKTGMFLAGFLPKVRKFLEYKRMPMEYTYPFDRIKTKNPIVKGITLREDQLSLIRSARKSQRGVILSPTGTGKTIMQLGLMSSFSDHRILLLAHTIDIVRQTHDELKKKGFKNIQMLGGGKKGKLSGEIIVSTVQTFYRLDPEEYKDYFSIVICDEAHRVSGLGSGQYYQVLTNLNAPVKFGFTATLPDKTEAALALEGLIGPVIDSLTINEAAKLEILAKPKIKLIKLKIDHKVKNISNYNQAYDKGVVYNGDLNNSVKNICIEHNKKKEACLIFVNKVEHGRILQRMFENSDMYVPFIQGSTSPDEREKVKKALESKKILTVISTVVWETGINIPSLNAIILAGGGKSELTLIQKIGRGLRKTDDKDKVIIYDHFNPSSKFFIEHFGLRLCKYFDMGWME